MNGDTGHFIVMVVQTAVFLAPVLLIFYKQGRKDQVLDEVKRDVDGVGKKVAAICEKNDDALSDLKDKVEQIDRTLVQVRTTLEHIVEDVKELRKYDER